MLSEIGSNFWINPNEQLKESPFGTPEQFGCKGNDYVWLSTGRSAICYAIKTIVERHPGLKKTAVLPPFTCHTVIEPFLKAGYEVYYYPVQKDLTTTSDTIMRTAIEHDASIVLFHRYFGKDTLDGQIDKMCDFLRGLDKYTIEDCTQCLYSDFDKSSADFFVGSIRKWHGTPDGGFAVCHEMKFGEKPLRSNQMLEEAKVKASYAKYRYLFDHEGEKPVFLQLYRDAEDILESQTGFNAICSVSQKLQSNLDVRSLKTRRRENFLSLLSGLSNLSGVKPLFDKLGNGEVPLYFPLVVNERTSLQVHLVKHDIYAPVVWPKAECLGAVCEEAEYLYEHLLCIPIDQRYGVDDMNRVIDTIKEIIK